MKQQREPREMTFEEQFDLSVRLQSHDAYFRGLWDISRILFTSEVPTLCVEFDQNGDSLGMLINEDLWDELTPREKEFVICHEMHHFVGNHGRRFSAATRMGEKERQLVNIGTDVCINETLIRCYGFRREELVHENLKGGCFVDTVFVDKDGKVLPGIPNDWSSEEYVAKLKSLSSVQEIIKDLKAGKPEFKPGPGTPFDDHSVMENMSKEILDHIQDILEDNGLVEFVEQEDAKTNGNPITKDARECKAHGTGSGSWQTIQLKKKPVKRKWESIIRKWVRARILDSEHFPERWDLKERRMVDIMENGEFMLPSNPPLDTVYEEKSKINVAFVLDTSGSCFHLKDRFFTAASTIPLDKFNVRLFCFDTRIWETTLASGKIYGGGGTNFRPVVNKIEEIERDEKWKPDAVFVITDGYFSDISVLPHVKNWHIFYTPINDRTSLPAECHKYNLSDFE